MASISASSAKYSYAAYWRVWRIKLANGAAQANGVTIRSAALPMAKPGGIEACGAARLKCRRLLLGGSIIYGSRYCYGFACQCQYMASRREACRRKHVSANNRPLSSGGVDRCLQFIFISVTQVRGVTARPSEHRRGRLQAALAFARRVAGGVALACCFCW